MLNWIGGKLFPKVQGVQILKAILFDWHGVIVNQPYREWIQKHAYSEASRKILLDLADEVDLGHINLREFRILVAREVDSTPERVAEEMAVKVMLNAGLLSFIEDTLVDLFPVVGVLSNVNLEFLIETMSAYKLESDFGLVLASSALGIVKPDPRIYKIALEQLDASAGEVVFVDDTAENVVAAQQAGMHGFVYETTRQLEEVFEARGIV